MPFRIVYFIIFTLFSLTGFAEHQEFRTGPRTRSRTRTRPRPRETNVIASEKKLEKKDDGGCGDSLDKVRILYAQWLQARVDSGSLSGEGLMVDLKVTSTASKAKALANEMLKLGFAKSKGVSEPLYDATVILAKQPAEERNVSNAFSLMLDACQECRSSDVKSANEIMDVAGRELLSLNNLVLEAKTKSGELIKMEIHGKTVWVKHMKTPEGERWQNLGPAMKPTWNLYAGALSLIDKQILSPTPAQEILKRAVEKARKTYENRIDKENELAVMELEEFHNNMNDYIKSVK